MTEFFTQLIPVYVLIGFVAGVVGTVIGYKIKNR